MRNLEKDYASYSMQLKKKKQKSQRKALKTAYMTAGLILLPATSAVHTCRKQQTKTDVLQIYISLSGNCAAEVCKLRVNV